MAETSSRMTKVKELDLLGTSVVMQGTFVKYGMDKSTKSKITCLTNLVYKGIELLDHVWVHSDKLVGLTLRTGQAITIKAKLVTRERPPDSIYGELKQDIQLKRVRVL